MVSQFGSLVYTSRGRLLIWQLSRRQSLTPSQEGKPQTFITKEAGCSQSAVSKHVNRKLSGRKKCGRKMHNQPRETQLMRIVKHPIQEFGWTSQGMDWGWGQGIKSHHTQTCQEFGYSCRQRRLTWAKEKKTVAQWCKILFSDEQVLYFIWKPRPRVGGRVEKLIAQVLEVQC